MKRTSSLLMVGIIVFTLILGYGGVLFFQKSSAESDLQQVTEELADLQKKKQQYANQNVLEAINAKKTLEKVDTSLLKWSKVIRDIRKTLPKDDDIPLVDVISYSGSTTNEISMNVKTVSGSDAPYFDVSDFIKAFDQSGIFKETFVPSISKGIDKEGKQVLTFLVNTVYVPSSEEDGEFEAEESLETAIGEVLEDSLEDSEEESAPVLR